MNSLIALYQQLVCQKPAALQSSLLLSLPHARYRICSNSYSLLQNLHNYFADCIAWQTPQDRSDDDVPVYLWHTPDAAKLIAAVPWQDWSREAGKSGRKDAVFALDFAHGKVRLLHKVKTNVLFIQPSSHNRVDHLMAFGPLEQHPNQMINFVLTQYLNQHLRADWLLGHAAGLLLQGRGVAIAGLSGGGKSTLMLHLLAHGEHFISNDRLLLKRDAQGKIMMRGIPKQPRINPGTIVHNPRLHPLITEAQRQAFLSMPNEQLRALEQKYDAPVTQLFWPNCYRHEAPLEYLVVLNWQTQSTESTRLKQTTLEQSPALLAALIKSPGPFYCAADGNFLANGSAPQAEDYRQLLSSVKVLELNGKVDFTAAQQQILSAID